MIRNAFRNGLCKLPGFIKAAHCEQDGLPSSRRIIFSVVIVAALFFVAADLVIHFGFRAESIDVLKTVIYAAAAFVGVSRLAEHFAERGQ